VVNVAVTPLSVPVPRVEAPSWNVTIPVGVPAAEVVTVAVKVTAAPKIDELFDEATEMESACLFTVCVRIGEVPPAKFPSPP